MIDWSRATSAVATREGLRVSSLGEAPVTVKSRRVEMRDLWDEHVALTRMVIVGTFERSPGLPATVERLLKNQDRIGALVGGELGMRLAGLLREHISIAGKLLVAMRDRTRDTLPLKAAWYANGSLVADLLASTGRWDARALRAMMRVHLDTTAVEAADQRVGDWAGSLLAYDVARQHVLRMAEALSDGLGY